MYEIMTGVLVETAAPCRIYFEHRRLKPLSSVDSLQVSVLGRRCGELLEFASRVAEGRSVASPRSRRETTPEDDSKATGPRSIGRPAQESHAVRLPHCKDGEQPREGLGQMHKTPHCLD